MHHLTSYALYLGTIGLSVAFAWLAHARFIKTGRYQSLSPVLWLLSFVTLWIVMGFRYEIGVDYFSYQQIYGLVADLGFFGYYEAGHWLEPGYIGILYCVHLLYGDFVGVFATTSLVGLGLFYSAFAFEAKYINPAWCVFIFGTTQYYYYFGIDRLFLAVAIVAYALRFVTMGRMRKYIVMVLIAACFHVSSLVMLCLPLLYRYMPPNAHGYRALWKRWQPSSPLRLRVPHCLFVICLVPAVFFAVRASLPLLPARYHYYSTMIDVQGTITSLLAKLPIALLVLATMRRTVAHYPTCALYGQMYIMSLFAQAFSQIAGVGRIGWYFWISLCFAFPFMIKSYSRNVPVAICLAAFVVAYCIVYMFHAYLRVDAARWEVMFPYRNVFFEL